MTLRHICTACRHIDNELDVIERDGYRIDPQLGVVYGDRASCLTPSTRKAFYLIAVSPRTLSPQTLELKIAGESGSPRGKDYVSRLKQALKRADIPWPITQVWGEGYLWVGPERAALPRKVPGWFGSPAHLASISKGA